MSEFGNTGWIVYVTAAYAVVGLVLGGFLAFTLRERSTALQRLKDEGWFSDKQKK